VIPLSGRVPGRASGPSRSHVDDGGGLQYVLRKIDRSLRFFPSRGIYRRKGGVRGWTSWSHPLVAWARGGPRHPRVWPGSSPLHLIFGLCEASGKIEGLAFVLSNFENISYVAFQKHKKSRKQRTGTMASR
jgi:hypothetical protein